MLTELIEYARADPAVSAAALVGSAACRATDRWSDIDLAVRLAGDAEPSNTAGAWQLHLEAEHDVIDHLDLWSGAALHRVFFLADTLQVDLSFWPDGTFASNGEPFELLFGEANRQTTPSDTETHDVIGWAWLYALHARSAIACGRPWQALHMVNGLRDRTITLACLRRGIPEHQGRGVDQLPETFLSRLRDSLVAAPDTDQLVGAFGQVIGLVGDEIQAVDPHLATRLRPGLAVLVQTAS